MSEEYEIIYEDEEEEQDEGSEEEPLIKQSETEKRKQPVTNDNSQAKEDQAQLNPLTKKVSDE